MADSALRPLLALLAARLTGGLIEPLALVARPLEARGAGAVIAA